MKVGNSIERNKLHQSGQDLLEFALVLPVLLLVVFGVLDLGRLFHAGITITNAARVGARTGALSLNGVTAATIAEANNNNIDLSSAVISTNCVDGNLILGLAANGLCDYGDTYRVTISYQFNLIIDYVLSISNINLVRSAEMLVQ